MKKTIIALSLLATPALAQDADPIANKVAAEYSALIIQQGHFAEAVQALMVDRQKIVKEIAELKDEHPKPKKDEPK